jgi:hypothetical protein
MLPQEKREIAWKDGIRNGLSAAQKARIARVHGVSRGINAQFSPLSEA